MSCTSPRTVAKISFARAAPSDFDMNFSRCDTAAFIAVERKLAVQNLSDPDPPDWLQLVFGTHPKTLERIGYALTWARNH